MIRGFSRILFTVPATEIKGELKMQRKWENLRITLWKNHYHNFFLLAIPIPALTPAQRVSLIKNIDHVVVHVSFFLLFNCSDNNKIENTFKGWIRTKK